MLGWYSTLYISFFLVIRFSYFITQLVELQSEIVCWKRKGKAVPLQSRSGPESSRKLRFPDYMTTAQDGGNGCQPYAPAAFTPSKYSWYLFLLEAKSTPGP